MKTIVISVSGGLVQSVKVNFDEEVDVIILDEDNENCDIRFTI